MGGKGQKAGGGRGQGGSCEGSGQEAEGEESGFNLKASGREWSRRCRKRKGPD